MILRECPSPHTNGGPSVFDYRLSANCVLLRFAFSGRSAKYSSNHCKHHMRLSAPKKRIDRN